MKVAVVGAGIMGLAAAAALLRRGPRVELFEPGPAPNPKAASVDRHRLIRYAYGAEDGYCRMVAAAYGAWERLWGELGRRLYIETGTLALSRGGDDWAGRSRSTLERCGIACEELGRDELGRRFPFLDASAYAWGCRLASGGMLLAEDIVAALLDHLGRRGVAVHAGCRVEAVDTETGKVALAGGGRIAADRIVVAAGAWTGRLLAGMAPRARPSRQVIVYLEPPAELAEAWLKAPMVLDIGADSGFYAVPARPGIPMKVGDHRFSLQGDPDRQREPEADEAAAIVAGCRHRLKDIDRYRVIAAKTCFYDVAPEERFVVEAAGGRGWVLAGFSGHGFKFAPVIGERLAAAIDGEIDPGRLSRWAAGLAGDPGA